MTADLRDQRLWIQQWAGAGLALAEQRKNDLRNLTDVQALATSESLLSLVGTVTVSPARREQSGLVEQQAPFHRRPVK